MKGHEAIFAGFRSSSDANQPQQSSKTIAASVKVNLRPERNLFGPIGRENLRSQAQSKSRGPEPMNFGMQVSTEE